MTNKVLRLLWLLHRNFSWSVMFRGLGFSFIAVPFTLRSYSHNVFQIMHLGASIKHQTSTQPANKALKSDCKPVAVLVQLANVITVVILSLVEFAAT
ncbi:hypothetical protein C1O24_20695 [Vibrio diazotrophicus]|nr:hypothetical protein C1O24_20695 [Vibrio diazotrophicus]